MTTNVTPRLGLLMMATAMAQKETVFNEALLAFDALFSGTVISMAVTAPPGSPTDGDCYIVPTGATGAWAGKMNKLAFAYNGWQFIDIPEHFKVYNIADSAFHMYTTSGGWVAVATGTPTVLTDLTDVSVSGVTDGQVLKYDNATGKWKPLTLPVYPNTIAGQSDVDVATAPTDGQYLVWNAGESKWKPHTLSLPGSTLNSLTDVDVPTEHSGYVAIWDTGESKLKFVDPTTLISAPSVEHLADVSITGTPPTNAALVFNGAVWTASTTAIHFLFENMVDGPGTLEGGAHKILRVNAMETALEYASPEDYLTGLGLGLAGLSDVNVTEGTGINGYTLNWNQSSGKWVATPPVSAGSLSLSGLSDVNVTEGSGIHGYVLVWNNGPAKWEAHAIAASATTDTTDASNITSGTLALARLPAALQGAMSYQGVWNAATNSPALASGVGTKGYLYKVTTAGTTSIDGNAEWNVGDNIVFNGSTWDKWDGISSEVLSVAGRTGTIVLSYTDISGLSTVAHTGAYSDLSGLPTLHTTLAGLTDVNVTEGSGIDGYVLKWNNSTSKWIAAAETGGGGGGGGGGGSSTLAGDTDVSVGIASTPHRYYKLGTMVSNGASIIAISSLDVKDNAGASLTVSVATASSIFSGDPSPESMMFDGDHTTNCRMSANSDLTLDMGSPVAVAMLDVGHRELSLGATSQTLKEFDWSYSDDGTTWHLLGHVNQVPDISSDTSITHTTVPLDGGTGLALADGQVLTWDSATSKWKNKTPTGGTGGGVISVGAAPVGAHKHWRLSNIASQGETTTGSPPSWMQVIASYQLELRATSGGAAQIPATASGPIGLTGTVNDLYDGVGATNVYTAAGAPAASRFFQYDYATPVSVAEIGWKKVSTGTNSATQFPVSFDLSVSDDGLNWMYIGEVMVGHTWVDGTAETVSIPVPATFTGTGATVVFANSALRPPKAADFSGWLNSIGVTLTDVTTGPVPCLAAKVPSAGAQIAILKQTPPTAPYKITAKFRDLYHDSGSSWMADGLTVYNSVNSHALCFMTDGESSHPNILVNRWNSLTSWSTNIFNVPPNIMPEWFQIENDGTNLKFKTSLDGTTWTTWYSEAIATFIGAVDTVGLVYGNGSGNELVAACEHYHVGSDEGFLSPSAQLQHLLDVDFITTPPTNNQAVVWDRAALKWVPRSIGSAIDAKTYNRNLSINAPTAAQFSDNTLYGRGASATSLTLTNDNADGLVMQDVSGDGSAWRTQMRATPGGFTSFEVAARFVPLKHNTHESGWGLVFEDASHNAVSMQIYYAGGTSWHFEAGTLAGTGGSWGDHDEFTISGVGYYEWQRFAFDSSGNLHFYFSNDGKNWLEVNTGKTLSGYGVGTPTKYGFCVQTWISDPIPVSIPWFYSSEFPAPTMAPIAGMVGVGQPLAALPDVGITSPADGDVLTYDATSGLWKNHAPTGGGGGGGGGGAVGSHRYWKLTDMQPFGYDDNAVSLFEMRFYNGATQHTVSAAQSYPNYGVGSGAGVGTYPVSNLFDGSNSTLWAGLRGCSINVDFGSAKSVDSIQLRTRNNPYADETPIHFNLWYSDDGIFYKLLGLIDVAGALGITYPTVPSTDTDYTIPIPTTI